MNIDYIFNDDNAKMNCDDSFSVANLNFDKIAPVDGLDADVSPEIAFESDPTPYVKDISSGKKYKYVVSRMKMKNACFSEDFKNKLASLENVLGNYLVSCKYAPNTKGKYASFIKYAIDCDCLDCKKEDAIVETNGSIDGFFNDKVVENVAGNKICSKTGLPVFDPIKFDDGEKSDLFAKVVKVYPVALKFKSNYDAIVDPIDSIRYLFNSLDNAVFAVNNNSNKKDISEEYQLKDSDLNITVTSDVNPLDVEDYNGDVEGFSSVGDFELNNSGDKFVVNDGYNTEALFDIDKEVVVDNSPVELTNLVKGVDSIDSDFTNSIDVEIDQMSNMNDIQIDPYVKDIDNIDEKRGSFDF